MDTICNLLDIGVRISNLADAARSNQRSCEMLGSVVCGLTTVARDIIKMHTHEGTPPSAFEQFLTQLHRELEIAEELVRKAGSMGSLHRFLFAEKYQGDFSQSTANLNLLLTALNTTNNLLLAKNEHLKAKSESIQSSLRSLKKQSESMTFMREVSPDHQSIWIQISKTTDRLLNEVISRDEAKQEFMDQLTKLYDASDSQGSLPSLFNFLENEIRKGKSNKDKQARLFNELLLETVIRLTLHPPEWMFCPLTGVIMVDPVTMKESPDQTPVERSFAEEWFFDRGNKRCPITGQPLDDLTLIPNTDIKEQIEAWRQENGWIDSNSGSSASSNEKVSDSSDQQNPKGMLTVPAEPATPQFIDAEQRYRLDGRLGKTCLRCHDLVTNKAVAIKLMERGEDLNCLHVASKVLRHRQLFHPYIVNFNKVFLADKYLCIAMDFAEGGTLAHHVTEAQCLEENSARWFFQQLIVAVEHCSKEVGHLVPRIKLENVLLDEDQHLLKLGGFPYGLEPKKLSQSALSYTDPGSGYFPSVPGTELEKMDVWACGVALFHMLFGFDLVPRWKPTGALVTKEVIVSADDCIEIPTVHYPANKAKQLSTSCRDLLGKLLTAHPGHRMGLSEIKEHPWFVYDLPETLQDSDAWVGSSKSRNLQSEEEIKGLVQHAGTIDHE